jgi:outer membrane protein assembly factor BamB
MENQLTEIIETKNIMSSIDMIIKKHKNDLLIRNFEIKISDIIIEEEVRINSIAIGCIGDIDERIYVGANSNKILIYDIEGNFIDKIELEDGIEVKNILLSNIKSYNTKNDLIILTSNDAILFYGLNNKGLYRELPVSIFPKKGSITSLYATPLTEDYKPIFIGHSNGEVKMLNFSNYISDHTDKQIIPENEIIKREKIAAIIGGKNIVKGQFGLVVGYKNGVILLLDEKFKLITKVDIDKEIENIYINEFDNSMNIITDDNNIYNYLILDGEMKYNWNILMHNTVNSLVIDNNRKGFFTLSEDAGTLSFYDSNGNFYFTADPSFDATTGIIYNDELILASRNGEICKFKFNITGSYIDLMIPIVKAYENIFNLKIGNEFYEFFNKEFNSDESINYITQFLINYLSNKPDSLILNNILELFELKRYDTDTSEGLIYRIICNSKLSTVLVDLFPNTSLSNEIIIYTELIKNKIKETNLILLAEAYLKTDPIKYIKFMSEIKIKRLDKIWIQKLFDDDDVVGIKCYHDPVRISDYQILIATRKGTLYLLDKITGEKIWNFELNEDDIEISNIDVADVCSDKKNEIIIGFKSKKNYILILSTDKEKFRSSENKIDLNWNPKYKDKCNFNLYFSKITVTGIEDIETLIHKVQCFDFDNNTIKDLIISSQNGNLSVFYFGDIKHKKITPKTNVIEFVDDDVLEFEIIRNEFDEIILYTGTSSGNIERQIYNGVRFIKNPKIFEGEDAQITDLHIVDNNGKKYILCSSDDNFIYCLDEELNYLWKFKADDDVKSINVLKCKNQNLILAISQDTKLYALDFNGDKKWDYPLYSPLDKLFVIDNQIIIADSDGNMHALKYFDSNDIDEKINIDLQNIEINLKSYISDRNINKYVRIYAIQKLLSKKTDIQTLQTIVPLLSDEFESETMIKCELIKHISNHLVDFDVYNNVVLDALLDTIKDYSSEVRIEGIKSFLRLFYYHKKRDIDINGIFQNIFVDEDIEVKEYFIGALLNNKEITVDNKWELLLNLIQLNRGEEWVIDESVNSLGNLLNNIKNYGLLIKYFYELFELDLEIDKLELISDKFTDINIRRLFNLFIVIKRKNFDKLIDFYRNDRLNYENEKDKIFNAFIEKIAFCFKIKNYDSVDDIVDDKLLVLLSKLLNVESDLLRLIENLNEYREKNKIFDKIVYLGNARDNIEEFNKIVLNLSTIDWEIFNFAIIVILKDFIIKTAKSLRDDVYLDLYIENKNIILNENNIGDINLDVINNGFNEHEDIEVLIKPCPQFEIIENIGNIGSLLKEQSKKIYCRIKPFVIEEIEIVFEINYKKCLNPKIFKEKIFIKESVEKEWEEIINEYTSGSEINNDKIFVGRETIIEDIMKSIKRDPIFVMGHRRMGKTSLVKYIQNNYLINDIYIPVFVSAEKLFFQNMNNFLYLFSKPIVNQLINFNIIDEQKGESYLKNIINEGLFYFIDFFEDSLIKVKRQNKILVLIIDEYPIINEKAEKGIIDTQFLINLRGFMQNNSKEFKLIYTGASSLKYLKSQYSSNLMGVGKSVVVSFLTEKDVKQLISKPTNDLLKFDDSAFKYLMELSFGQPFIVQTILSYVVNKLNKEKKSHIVFKEMIEKEEGINHFINQIPHIMTDWGSFDDKNESKFYSESNWSQEEEITAKAYKQLIITSITDKWTKTKNGLTKEEIFSNLENGLKDIHKIKVPIFEETIKIMEGTADILKKENNIYLLKLGLFRLWVTNRMYFTFSKTLEMLKSEIFSKIN